ncbi:hypothetical protein NCCP2222_21630 [Sporosarcina sp. NCCP-2222]|nr:hypothetical protein NCCP2222_21630 [Sporosarcina sp. NCCP-2222]
MLLCTIYVKENLILILGGRTLGRLPFESPTDHIKTVPLLICLLKHLLIGYWKENIEGRSQ